MDRVGVEVVRPLPLIMVGNSYICVMIEYFIKWLEAYAITDQEATTIA